MRFLSLAIGLLALCGCSEKKSAAILPSYKCVSVHDGDTITLLTDAKEQIKIRFDGIDAPELKQDFGNASKRHLSDMVFGKSVSYEDHGVDRYNRVLAVVYVDGMNVNETMVRNGFAWHFKTYSKDKVLAQLEIDARTAKRGLWSQSNPVAPWDFRKKSK